MADALFKEVKDAHKQEDAVSTSQALATSLEALRKQVLEHFGIRLTKHMDIVMSRGLRCSNRSQDARILTLMPKSKPGCRNPNPDAELQARMSDSERRCRNPSQDASFLARMKPET